MNKNLIKEHLLILNKLKTKKPTLFVYKGFPNHFLKELEKNIPHIDKLSFVEDDNKTNLETIIKNAPATLTKLKKTKDNLLFISYEEMLLIPSQTLAELPVNVKVIRNNFYDYYPNQTTITFADIEDSINSDMEIEENELFNRFYADSRQFAGFNCIQFLDYEVDLT